MLIPVKIISSPTATLVVQSGRLATDRQSVKESCCFAEQLRMRCGFVPEVKTARGVTSTLTITAEELGERKSLAHPMDLVSVVDSTLKCSITKS